MGVTKFILPVLTVNLLRIIIWFYYNSSSPGPKSYCSTNHTLTQNKDKAKHTKPNLRLTTVVQFL